MNKRPPVLIYILACLGCLLVVFGSQPYINWLAPEKSPAMPVSHQPLVVAKLEGFLQEDTVIGVEGMNNTLCVKGDVTQEYTKGRFISFPTNANKPVIKPVAWQITSATYFTPDQKVFIFNRGDVTIVSVNERLSGVTEDQKVRLWEKDPTVELE